jgi:hypothetical protein
MSASTHFGVRLTPIMRERLEQTSKIVDLDAPTVVRALISAFVERVEGRREIRLPLAVVPKGELSFPCPPDLLERLNQASGNDAEMRSLMIVGLLKSATSGKASIFLDAFHKGTVEFQENEPADPKGFPHKPKPKEPKKK